MLTADGVEGGLGPPLEALAQLQRMILLVQQRVRRAVHGPAPARPVPAGPFLSSARRVRCRPAPFRAPSAAGKALRGRRRRVRSEGPGAERGCGPPGRGKGTGGGSAALSALGRAGRSGARGNAPQELPPAWAAPGSAVRVWAGCARGCWRKAGRLSAVRLDRVLTALCFLCPCL